MVNELILLLYKFSNSSFKIRLNSKLFHFVNSIIVRCNPIFVVFPFFCFNPVVIYYPIYNNIKFNYLFVRETISESKMLRGSGFADRGSDWINFFYDFKIIYKIYLN